MTTKVGRSIFLSTDIETIYDTLSDSNRITDWFEHVAEVAVTNAFPEVDGVASIVFKHGDVVLNYTMTAIEFVYGEYAVFKLDGDLVGTQRWSTRPVRGGYRLSIEYEYDLPSRGLNKFVERITRETLNKSLHNLKALLETKSIPAYF